MSRINPLVFLGFLILSGYFRVALAERNEPRRPLWEAGFAGGILSTPQYIGSDQRYTLPLGIPYLVYRGNFLKADREGVRGEFVHQKKYAIDLGFSFGLPVNNNNKARRGMPDLHLSGQVGPRFNWFFTADHPALEASFHWPLRYARDIKNNDLGWVTEPSLRLERKNLGAANRYTLRADLGLLYASRQYHQYYYGVAEPFSTSSRAAYDAESGLHSYFINVSGRYRQSETLRLGAFVRWKTMASSVVRDSPLVKDKNYWVIGMGLTWIFKKSTRYASDPIPDTDG